MDMRNSGRMQPIPARGKMPLASSRFTDM